MGYESGMQDVLKDFKDPEFFTKDDRGGDASKSNGSKGDWREAFRKLKVAIDSADARPEHAHFTDQVEPTPENYLGISKSGSSSADDTELSIENFDELCIVFGGVGYDTLFELEAAIGTQCINEDQAKVPIFHKARRQVSSVCSSLLAKGSVWTKYSEERLVSLQGPEDGVKRELLRKVNRLLHLLKTENIDEFKALITQDKQLANGKGGRNVLPATISLPLLTLTQLVTLRGTLRLAGIERCSHLENSTRCFLGHSAGMISAAFISKLFSRGTFDKLRKAMSKRNQTDSPFHQILSQAMVTSLVLGFELSVDASYQASPMLAVKGQSSKSLTELINRRQKTDIEGQPPADIIQVAVQNCEMAHVIVGSPVALQEFKNEILNSLQGTKSIFLDTDTPFHSERCSEAVFRTSKTLRSLNIDIQKQDIGARIISCHNGQDIRKFADKDGSLLENVLMTVAVLPVDWPAAAVTCGGCLVIDAGPGSITDFVVRDVCQKKAFPRLQSECCGPYQYDPYSLCPKCGCYDRSGAPFSCSQMLHAQMSLSHKKQEHINRHPLAHLVLEEGDLDETFDIHLFDI